MKREAYIYIYVYVYIYIYFNNSPRESCYQNSCFGLLQCCVLPFYVRYSKQKRMNLSKFE